MFRKINAYSEIVMNLVKMSQMEINELIRSEAKRIVYVPPTHFVCGYRSFYNVIQNSVRYNMMRERLIGNYSKCAL